MFNTYSTSPQTRESKALARAEALVKVIKWSQLARAELRVGVNLTRAKFKANDHIYFFNTAAYFPFFIFLEIGLFQLLATEGTCT